MAKILQGFSKLNQIVESMQVKKDAMIYDKRVIIEPFCGYCSKDSLCDHKEDSMNCSECEDYLKCSTHYFYVCKNNSWKLLTIYSTSNDEDYSTLLIGYISKEQFNNYSFKDYVSYDNLNNSDIGFIIKALDWKCFFNFPECSYNVEFYDGLVKLNLDEFFDNLLSLSKEEFAKYITKYICVEKDD